MRIVSAAQGTSIMSQRLNIDILETHSLGHKNLMSMATLSAKIDLIMIPWH